MKWGDTFQTVSRHPTVQANRKKIEQVLESTKKDPRLYIKVTEEGWFLLRKRFLAEHKIIESGFWTSMGDALSDMYFGTTEPHNVSSVRTYKK